MTAFCEQMSRLTAERGMSLLARSGATFVFSGAGPDCARVRGTPISMIVVSYPRMGLVSK